MAGACADMGCDWVVVMLAVLKSDMAVVPLAGGQPRPRLADLCRRAGVGLLVLQEPGLWPGVPEAGAEVVISLSQLLSEEEEEEEAEGGPVASVRSPWDVPLQREGHWEVAGDAALWVLFTSGSSGGSKVVQGSHYTTLTRLRWYWDQFPFQAGEVMGWDGMGWDGMGWGAEPR